MVAGGHRGRRGPVGVGLGLRREARAEQFHASLLFYYLFMYGVGLRVGPSFINSLKGDGLKFTFLAFVSCVIGLALVVHLRKVVRAADRRRRRHAGGLADHVGGDRLGRAGDHLGRRSSCRRA